MPDTEVRPAPAPAEVENQTSAPSMGPPAIDEMQDDTTGWLSLRKPQVNLHWHRRYMAEETGE